MAPWSPTAASSGGSVVTRAIMSTFAPLAGSTQQAGGAGMGTVTLSRLPRWPHGLRAAVPCLAWPWPAPKTKAPGLVVGGLALVGGGGPGGGHWEHGPT